MQNLKVIAFDADDTLWINEPLFQKAEHQAMTLLSTFLPPDEASKILLATERTNVSIYGFGVKSFILSLIETAINISKYQVDARMIEQILALGKALLNEPIVLLENVEAVLQKLQGKYQLVLATKGDLLDQEKKVARSGLAKYFDHVQVMSNKNEADYSKLLRQLNIEPNQFLMLGNSLKSDILPVLNMDGHAFHIPYHMTWEFEKIDTQISHANFKTLESIREVLDFV